MKLRWHGEARAEADAAAAFYNEKQAGLAQRFLDNLDEALTGYNAIRRSIVRWKATSANAGFRIFPTV